MSLKERTLYLSNLPESVQESDIRVFLSGLSDEIEYIKVYEHKIAFVVLNSEDDVDQAQMYDGSEMGGQEIAIEQIDSTNKEKFEKFEMEYVQRKLNQQKSQVLLQELQNKNINDKLVAVDDDNQQDDKEDKQQKQEEQNQNKDSQENQQGSKIKDFVNDEDGVSTPTKEDFQKRKIKISSDVYNKLTQSQQIEFNMSSQNSFANSESINDNQLEQKSSQINSNMQEIQETNQEHLQNSLINVKNPDFGQADIKQEESEENEEKFEQFEIRDEQNQEQKEEQIQEQKEEQIQEQKEEENQEQKDELEQNDNLQQLQQNECDLQESEQKRPQRNNIKIEDNEEEENLIKKLAQEKNRNNTNHTNNFNINNNKNKNIINDDDSNKDILNNKNDDTNILKNQQEVFQYDFRQTKIQYGFAIVFLVLFFFLCQLAYKVLDIERVVSDQQEVINNLLNSTISNNNGIESSDL